MRRRVQVIGAAALFCAASVAAFSSPAAAGLMQWQAEVAAGTPAGYTNTNITSPLAANIGTYSEATGGGISYEFIVNATNDNSSSTLMGRWYPQGGGEQSALKWEQYPNLSRYGVTTYAFKDWDFGVANTPNVDTHLVFVNNSVNTLLYVNGVLAATIANCSPNLSGLVGIGAAYSFNDTLVMDKLTGTIYGVAVYDAALSAAEIVAHAAAWAVPEPGGLSVAAFCGSLAVFRRSRRERGAIRNRSR